MNKIDYKIEHAIDFPKFMQPDELPVYDITSPEWGRAFQAEEPGIYLLRGLHKIADQPTAQRAFRKYTSEFRGHPRHLALIARSEMEYVWGEDHLNFKLPRNVWVVDEIDSEDQLPNYPALATDEEYSKVVQLDLPIENLNPEDLRGNCWVRLCVNAPMNQQVLDQIHGILRYCNQNSIPVWSTDSNIRSEVLKAEQIDINNASSGVEGLFFDLPNHKGYQLIDVNDVLAVDVRVLGDSISAARNKSKSAEMEAGYALLRLDFTARVNGKGQFWSQQFGVKNRYEYCSKVLGISGGMGSQYLSAVRNLEILKPGYLEQLFLSGEDSAECLPHGYTHYRDLTLYIPEIIELKDHPSYHEIEGMIQNPNLSSRQMLRELPLKIATLSGKITIPSEPNAPVSESASVNVRADDLFDIFGCINQFRADILEHVPPDYVERFNIYIEGFTDMFMTTSVYGPIDYRLEDEARSRFENESNQFADLAPWEVSS